MANQVSDAMSGSKASIGLHPAAIGCTLFIFVAVGRLPEVLPVLAPFGLGKLAVGFGAVALLWSGKGSEFSLFRDSLGRRMAMLGTIATISVGYSIWGSQSLEVLVNSFVVIFVGFYLLAKSARSMKEIDLYIISLICSAGILSYLTITEEWVGRLSSVGDTYDPNDLAMVLVTIMPLAMARVYLGAMWTRLIFLVILVVMLLAVVLTGSRGGFLGLAVVAMYFSVTQFSRAQRPAKRRLSLLFVVMICVTAVVLWFIAPQSTKDQILSLAMITQDYNVTESEGRLSIWQRGLELMVDRPIGLGIGAFPAAEGGAGGRYMAAHNALIQIGVELGVTGLAVFLSLYTTALRRLATLSQVASRKVDAEQRLSDDEIKARNYGIALRGSLFAFFVTSFFLAAAYATVFYTLLAITAAISTWWGQEELTSPRRDPIRSESQVDGHADMGPGHVASTEGQQR